MTAALYDADRRYCACGAIPAGMTRKAWVESAARHQATLEPRWRAEWYAIDGGELVRLPVVAQVALPGAS